MDIKVSNASCLFKENGHDLKGIITLFYNAVWNEVAAPVSVLPYASGDFSLEYIAEKERVNALILGELETFSPNIDFAEQRVQQWENEHAELKKIAEQIKVVSVWTLIFGTNKKVNQFVKRRAELEAQTLTLKELLDIAFYKFSLVKGTKKQFKEGMARFLNK